MIHITHKSNTLRKAIAEAVVKTSSQATIEAVRNRAVPKGDVLEFARVAGLFAVKKNGGYDTRLSSHASGVYIGEL